MYAAITGIHYCLAPLRVTNDELALRFNPKLLSSIAKMSGIVERRVAPAEVTASDLAFIAASRLLEGRGLDPQEIDLLVFVSQTGDHQIPATACSLHGRLKLAAKCAAFDVNLGCSGYPYGLALVSGLIATGVARKALLLNADTLTHVIHPRDRGLVPLHGDGAVATFLERAEQEETGVCGSYLGTDGSGAQHLIIPASGARKTRTVETRRELIDESGNVRSDEHLSMNGPAIFHFSVYKVPEVVREALATFKVSIEDLDLVILHQANRTMIELIYKALAVPIEKRFYFLEKIGNMSGASTPMALAEAVRTGRVKPSSVTLLVSFGVGLSWGVTLIRWPSGGVVPVEASVEFPYEFA